MQGQDTFYLGDFHTKETPSFLLVVKLVSCSAQALEKKPGSLKEILVFLWLKTKVFFHNYIELGGTGSLEAIFGDGSGPRFNLMMVAE